jgi:molybdopterin-guanine dinucleotide biosynthesis protein
VSAGPRPFGAVLAGGQSVRYGSTKALATVGGVPIIERVLAALRRITPDLILLANEPDLFADLGIPTRPDVRPGLGALGGIHTGLLWAREAGRPGILAVACDMPFPCEPLLRRIHDEAFARPLPPDMVVPESGGRRGIEPLFAAYGVGCLPAIEAGLARDDRRMIGFHDAVTVRRIPLADVGALCDPAIAFLNVNTPAERERAERHARGGPA